MYSWRRGLLPCALLALSGCAQGPAGTASFTVVSKKLMDSERSTVVEYLDVKMCTRSAFIFVTWGDTPNHEFLLRKALDEHHADALTNAHLDFTSLPLLLYNESCVRLRGDLVRLNPSAGGTPAAETAPAAEPAAEGGMP